MNEDWFFTHDNVCALARWLKSEGHWEGKGGVGNLIYFFEKPWKYSQEWKEYQDVVKREKENAEKTRI